MSEELLNSTSSISIESIYAAIRDNGFSEQTTQLIDNFTNDILNGKTNLTQFNQAEHAGLCCAGEMLIGAYIVSCYARTSLEASANASASQVSPANWQIDELQEKMVQQWAEDIQDELTELINQHFALPFFEFVYDEHWDLGHGWSGDF